MNRAERRAQKRLDPVRAPSAHAAEAQNNRGIALAQQGLLAEALLCFQRATALRSAFPAALNNLGNVYRGLDQLDLAAPCYEKAIQVQPDFAEAFNNLGTVLARQGRWKSAIDRYQRAIALRPNYPAAWNNLGNAHQKQGELEEAAACCGKAIALEPCFAAGHNSQGMLLAERGQLREASACYRRAIALQPDLADAHFNLACGLLAQGDMETGWQEHEWRWNTPQMFKARRGFAQPQWRGEPGGGRTLLIHAEQGFGDIIQFCRYATLAAARGWRVVMEVQSPLASLLRTLPDVDLVVVRGNELPGFDLHCPMLSLPLALGTTLASIPSSPHYLAADPHRAAGWGARLDALGARHRRVGLAWAGSATLSTDRRRSLPLSQLAPLFADPSEFQFFSLQKGEAAAPDTLPLINFMDEMADFSDTAALIANLDLVISVDTAVLHLAGALGKPVFMLDRFDPDWRWLVGRSDSPWYPTLRIYRQPRRGDWEAVLMKLMHDLRYPTERR